MIESKTAIGRQRAIEIAACMINESQLEGQIETALPGQTGFTCAFEKTGPHGAVTALLSVRLKTVGCRSTLVANVKLPDQTHAIEDLSTLRALLYDLLLLGSFVQQSLGNFDIMDPN
jgi:hypothetical protein